MARFSIDPDIRRASTLPSEFYTDENHFSLARDRIFARTWQFAGRENSSSVRPLLLLPEMVAEPIVFTRDDAGQRACLSNVCTHRGKVVAEAECDATLLKCDYHGRRFGLDGKFLSMPEFEEALDFPSPADDLTRIPSGTAFSFDFVSIDPVVPLREYVADCTPEDLALSPLDGLKLTAKREYQVNAHWALYCENYLEGFHIPYVHKSLNQIIDYPSYTTETMRYSSVQRALDKDGRPAANYVLIFPNTMLNFYPWGVSVNIVRPVTSSRSIIEFQTYVADEALVGKGAGGDLDAVELEDEAVVESVQVGIRSRYYSRGRYSPTREQGTHHFHKLIAEFIG